MSERAAFSRRYLAWALAVVFLANVLNYLDRQVVSSVESEIRPAFGMNKTEFGYLWSAFTLGYMVFAPLVGFLSDRRHRPSIFAACILVWSAATIGSGLVHTTTALYGMRFLIGVGEAGCLVVGPALLVDYFPASARGRALSIFYLGMPIGGAAGYILGGIVSEYFGGFRTAFVIAGAPGILLALGIWFLREPGRGPAPDEEKSRGVRAYLDLLRNPSLLLIILAQTFAVGILAPILHFAVRFFEESRGMSKVEATLTLAVIALVAGIVGASLSGIVGDRLARRRKGAYALLAGIGYGVGMPCMLLGFTSPSPWVFAPALFLGSMCLFLCMPAVNTEIANVVSPSQRAMAYALAVFVLHLLGDMAAPPVFGTIADRIGTENAFFGFTFLLLGASLAALAASRRAVRDIERFATSPGTRRPA